MKVGDRVKFIGPEYEHAVGTKIGQLGTVKERAGYRSQKVGEAPEELITVDFDGAERPTVLSINRLELLNQDNVRVQDDNEADLNRTVEPTTEM